MCKQPKTVSTVVTGLLVSLSLILLTYSDGRCCPICCAKRDKKFLSLLSALNIRAVKQQFRKINQNDNVRLEVLVAVT